MKILFRRWGAPTSDAPRKHPSIAYPDCSRPSTTVSSPREASANTFSTTTTRGRFALIVRSIANQSPLRLPSSPLPFPAKLMSWQGNPPQMMSVEARAALSASFTSFTDRSAFGQCIASTPRQNGSISTCQSVGPRPAHSSPSSNPPIPEKSDPMVMRKARPVRGSADDPSTTLRAVFGRAP